MFASIELVLPPLVRNSGYAILNLTRLDSITPSVFVQGGRTQANCDFVCEPGVRLEVGAKLAFTFSGFLGSTLQIGIGYAHPLVGLDGEGRFFVDLVVSPVDDQIVYLTLSGFGTSHLYWSDNGGGAWINIGAGLPDVPTQAVIVDPDNPDHLYVGNDLGVYVSVDHGLNWHTFGEGLPTAVMVMDLSISPSTTRFASPLMATAYTKEVCCPRDISKWGKAKKQRVTVCGS